MYTHVYIYIQREINREMCVCLYIYILPYYKYTHVCVDSCMQFEFSLITCIAGRRKRRGHPMLALFAFWHNPSYRIGVFVYQYMYNPIFGNARRCHAITKTHPWNIMENDPSDSKDLPDPKASLALRL